MMEVNWSTEDCLSHEEAESFNGRSTEILAYIQPFYGKSAFKPSDARLNEKEIDTEDEILTVHVKYDGRVCQSTYLPKK